MSDELARLRADLKVLDEIRARYDKDADFTTLVNDMRDRIEAEADPWREAKKLMRALEMSVEYMSGTDKAAQIEVVQEFIAEAEAEIAKDQNDAK